MSLLKCKIKLTQLHSINYQSFRFINLARRVITDQDEYSETPNYPPIVEVSPQARRQGALESWKNQIKNLETIEEKLMKINMPRFYGWRSIMLNDKSIPYNALNFIQSTTRTCFNNSQKLPSFYDTELNISQEKMNSLVSSIEDQIKEALTIEFHLSRRPQSLDSIKPSPSEIDDLISTNVSKQINRIITNELGQKYPHLFKAQIDLDPRHEAFWFVGGIKPPLSVVRVRELDPFQKDISQAPVDRGVQYIGQPSLALRHKLPLKPILPLSESENPEWKVPVFEFDPRVIGYNSEHRHGTNIPGFWPGDSNQFGLLSFNRRGHILDRLPSFGEVDNIEALHGQAILQSYSWLLSQACYLGFSTYNELTYPLVTQTIITNGKLWSFYVYQLNTTLLHRNNIHDNPKKNLCWGTEPIQLFDHIDQSNGNIVGFNPKVLENLIKFYINRPEKRDHEMTPYLSASKGGVKYVANLSDDERRAWLEKHFKHMMANKPRNRQDLLYEIHQWEYIYKIQNKTRQLEPKHRPFEVFKDPISTRRYDDHQPAYVPKKLRPPGLKRKSLNRWEKTYYP